MNQHLVADESVRKVIDNYTPRGIDLYHWLALQRFVREAVSDTQPTDPDEARRRLTLISALADWVGYQACFPVERQTVFDLEVMGAFIDTGNAWSPKVKKMARGRLKTMAKALNPDWKDVPEETAYTSAWDPKPYSDNEVLDLKGWARGQRTSGRRIKAEVLLALTLGAGLHAHEIVRLRVRDVLVDDEGVMLRVAGQTRRSVPVRADHEKILVGLKANVADEEYAFAPGRVNRKSSVIQNFIKSSNRNLDVFPSPRRMRATWIVGHLQEGVPPSALVSAAGLTNLRSFERWLYAYPEYNRDKYREFLRKPWRDAKRSR